MAFYAYTLPNRTATRWIGEAGRGLGHRTLRVNVRDEGEVYLLQAFVPGLKAEDLKIQVLDDEVHIEGQGPETEGELLLSELPEGTFRRALRLPTALEADKVEATIAEGVLSLRLPKAETARPRTIKVAAN